MSDSTTIDREASVARFELPDIEGTVIGGLGGGMPTARQIEQMHREAYDEGFESGRSAGYTEGLERGVAEQRRRAEVLDGVLRELTAPLAELDEEMVEPQGPRSAL